MHTFVHDDLKSYLLSFAPLKGHHTADVLLAEFEKVINYYHIEKKLVRLITDNASNNLKAFNDILLPGFESYFENDECNQSIVADRNLFIDCLFPERCKYIRERVELILREMKELQEDVRIDEHIHTHGIYFPAVRGSSCIAS